MQSRLQYIDLSKGILIFLVCLGHAIQYTTTEKNFLENPIWQTIYAFHMPLFMILSGWFFKVDKWSNLPRQIGAKITRLIVPLFSFNLITWGLQVAFGIKDASSFFCWLGCETFYLFAMRYWFLMALFLCFTITSLLKIIVRNNMAIMLICFVAGFLLKPLGKYYIGFMLPFFFMGYLLNIYKDIWMKYASKLLVICGVMFGIMLFGWRGEWTIYYTELRCLSSVQVDLHNLFVGLYRYVLGAAGSGFVIIGTMKLLPHLPQKISKTFTALGCCTLGIYMCQTVFFDAFLSKQGFSLDGVMWMAVSLLFSVAVCAICYAVSYLLQQSKYTNILLLGGYKWKRNKTTETSR